MRRTSRLLLIFVLALALPCASAGARTAKRTTVHHAHRAGHKHKHKRTEHGHRKHRRHRHHKHRHRHHKHPARHAPAVASQACAGADLTPTQANLEAARAATLCLVNAERSRDGEPALIDNARLSEAATGHSYDMVARDYFEHVSPDGQTLLTRVHASKFIPNSHVGYTLGENIAWGTLWLATPRSIVKAWMADPGHRANILKRSFRCSGIGIDPAAPASKSRGQAGAMYTQDFGTIIAG